MLVQVDRDPRPNQRWWAFGLVATGAIVKHIVLPVAPYELARSFPEVIERLKLMILIGAIFCPSFARYLPACVGGIVRNAFGYSGLSGWACGYSITNVVFANVRPVRCICSLIRVKSYSFG